MLLKKTHMGLLPFNKYLTEAVMEGCVVVTVFIMTWLQVPPLHFEE